MKMLSKKKLDLVSLHDIYDAIEVEFKDHLKSCRDFLRQKSVSATGNGIKETANIIRGFIEELGGDVEYEGDPAYPIVYGRVDRNKKNTLIIYGMYDVQPAEESNWISPPFEAKIHTLPNLGECIVARGAVNSKGALCGVFRANGPLGSSWASLPLLCSLWGNWWCWEPLSPTLKRLR